ncbi:hypothetical protein BDZ45DRAFT_212336 [Acephala macrosclerotiorum]|nr:hypothetical protein BDZ45DRAFT_212336 [Acephala macrosclerotiorum]
MLLKPTSIDIVSIRGRSGGGMNHGTCVCFLSISFSSQTYGIAVVLLICVPFDVYNMEDIAIVEGQVLQRYLCFLWPSKGSTMMRCDMSINRKGHPSTLMEQYCITSSSV